MIHHHENPAIQAMHLRHSKIERTEVIAGSLPAASFTSYILLAMNLFSSANEKGQVSHVQFVRFSFGMAVYNDKYIQGE